MNTMFPSSRPEAPLLAVEGLQVAYGGALAVRDLSFQVAPGAIVALVGANGAGKTTTVQTVAGALKPRAGRILFDGEDIAGMNCRETVARGVTLVPEGRLVFPQMTVEENLHMGALNKRATPLLRQSLDHVYAMFPRLAQRRRQLGGSMSGGEQQMLAIARGLMARPRLMILDEPSLGLSPKLVAELFTTVRNLNAEGITVVLVEQNVRQTLAMAHGAYVLEKGAAVLSGTGAELLDSPFVRKAFLGL
jgi:branched-chain amino acid transport system ATP-binding protein